MVFSTPTKPKNVARVDAEMRQHTRDKMRYYQKFASQEDESEPESFPLPEKERQMKDK